MSTTPAAIVAALRYAVDATGDAWRLIEQPEELVGAEAIEGYRVLPFGGPNPTRATGLAGCQVLEQQFTVELHQALAGDPAAEDPQLLERARRVADSIEYEFVGYPAGVEAVLVETRGGVVREHPSDSTWATVRLGVRVLYQAALGAAA